MKAILLASLMGITTCVLKAQTHESPAKYKTITKDTINIRGVLYDYLGKPVRYAVIYSTNRDLSFDRHPLVTQTDTNGRFQLKGALPHDTLAISAIVKIKVINNGSRYIEIKLPEPKRLERSDSVIVIAHRQNKKTIPTFKIEQYCCYEPFMEVRANARFKGEPGGFAKYVSSKVSYPQKAIENNIEGEVEIGFTVERDGSIINTRVIRGIGYGCDEEVIRVVKRSLYWFPAILDGKPIINKTSVVVDFKLTD